MTDQTAVLPVKDSTFGLLQDDGHYIDFNKEIFAFNDEGTTAIEVVLSFDRKTETCLARVDRTNEDGQTRILKVGKKGEEDVVLPWEKGLALLDRFNSNLVTKGSRVIDFEAATDSEIDWAVSFITNPEWTYQDRIHNTVGYVDSGEKDDEPYSPTSNAQQFDQIVEDFKISIGYSGHWEANIGPISASSVNRKRAALRALLHYACKSDVINAPVND